MDNQNNIPPQKKDLTAARSIGEALPDLGMLNTSEDPLLDALMSYRQSELNKDSQQAPDSRLLWARIESEITRNEEARNTAPVFTLGRSFTRYAAAAAILIMALAGVLYYQQNYVPVLLGQSGESIETVILEDGSSVTLRPYSKLFRRSASAGSQFHIEGEALFEVTHDPDRTFTVYTPESKVEVLGTTFTLSDWGEESELYLREGSVRITNRISDRSMLLEPGERAGAGSDGDLSKSKTDGETYTDWLNRQLTFRNASASYIFKELEQQFNIRIESDEISGDISGTINLDQLDGVLADLELLLNGTFTSVGERSYRFQNN